MENRANGVEVRMVVYIYEVTCRKGDLIRYTICFDDVCKEM